MRIVNVPDDVRRDFKVLCAMQEKSMREKILELMRAAIEKEMKKK